MTLHQIPTINLILDRYFMMKFQEIYEKKKSISLCSWSYKFILIHHYNTEIEKVVYKNENVEDVPDEDVTETMHVMEDEAQFSSPEKSHVKSSNTRPKEVCIQLPASTVFFVLKVYTCLKSRRNSCTDFMLLHKF